jgi:hypothetical protein
MTLKNLLHRQVHPNFIQSNLVSQQAFHPTSPIPQPTPQVFKPTPKDNGYLSVSDGNMIDAKGSFEKFKQNPHCQSIGVLSVSCSECSQWELQVLSDPIKEQPEHTLIDFSEKTNSVISKAAAGLRDYAIKRGWSYLPQQ